MFNALKKLFGRDRKRTKHLTEEVAGDYLPGALPGGWLEGASSTPTYARVFLDTEAMLCHPRVSASLNYYKSGISGCEFTVEDASDGAVADFALKEIQQLWRSCLRDVQQAYEYGRGACEIVYSDEGGLLRLKRLRPFHPADVRPLVLQGKLWGVRVRGGRTQALELRAAIESEQRTPRGTTCVTHLPAKVYWHAHNVRLGRWYGQPQVYAAWRPWRRLAGRDGAEDILDGGVYRFAFAPPIGRYPPEDQPGPGPFGPGSRFSNRDKMRQMLEQLKAGGVVALSSRKDESGSYVWDLHWPERTLDVSGLIAYTTDLEKAISLGIGVFPELLEASEVGSGYSGRQVPLQAFLWGQQLNAEQLLSSWCEQVLDPLIRFNFGNETFARIRVGNLLDKLRPADSKPGGGDPMAQMMQTLQNEQDGDNQPSSLPGEAQDDH